MRAVPLLHLSNHRCAELYPSSLCTKPCRTDETQGNSPCFRGLERCQTLFDCRPQNPTCDVRAVQHKSVLWCYTVSHKATDTRRPLTQQVMNHRIPQTANVLHVDNQRHNMRLDYCGKVVVDVREYCHEPECEISTDVIPQTINGSENAFSCL